MITDKIKGERRIVWQKMARVIAATAMLAIGVGILTMTINGTDAANRDFISYWAAGQQLIHHGNPYDAPAILHIEHAAGYRAGRAFFMRNSPISLFAALPLGLVQPRLGAILWSLAIIGCLMGSIRLLITFFGKPEGDVHLFCYLFPPVLACILQGQTGVFVLFGLTLFLYFYKTRPFLAGTALLICAMKPHLFMPLACVLAAWTITRKDYRILLGAGTALLASSGLSIWLDPRIWSHYAAMMRAENIQNEFIPNLSLLVRLSIDRSLPWLQFLPALMACAWSLYYFGRHRSEWDWRKHGQLVLIVSVLVAPYSWFTDESVLLPAILGGLYLAESRNLSIFPYLLLSGVAMIEVMFGILPNSGFYLWTVPAWLGWYLYIQRRGTVAIADCAQNA